MKVLAVAEALRLCVSRIANFGDGGRREKSPSEDCLSIDNGHTMRRKQLRISVAPAH